MEKKIYKLIIFDVDGTLLDTSEGIIKSAEYTMEKLGYKRIRTKQLYDFVGPRIQDVLHEKYGLVGDDLIHASAIFRNHYKEENVLLAVPYEGVYEVLDELKSRGKYLAIATNKRQDFVEALIDRFQLDQYFNVVHGADFEGKLQKSDLIVRCMNEFPECNNQDVVMIGDSKYDAIASKEVGVDFIGVTYGFDFKTAEDIVKWDSYGVANNTQDILELIRIN